MKRHSTKSANQAAKKKKRLPKAGQISSVSSHHPSALVLIIFWGVEFHNNISWTPLSKSAEDPCKTKPINGRCPYFWQTGPSWEPCCVHTREFLEISRALPMLLGGISGQMVGLGPNSELYSFRTSGEPPSSITLRSKRMATKKNKNHMSYCIICIYTW